MATTVHLPPELLKRVDERAKRLKISRNQYVRRALEGMIEKETSWSRRFLDALTDAASDHDAHDAVDEMVATMDRRSRKGPPAL